VKYATVEQVLTSQLEINPVTLPRCSSQDTVAVADQAPLDIANECTATETDKVQIENQVIESVNNLQNPNQIR
jgi:hypothetical protein